MKYSSEWKQKVIRLNHRLLKMYGPQGWWPVTAQIGSPPVYFPGREGLPVSDEHTFEIMAGAILTQNTAWINVEKALVNLGLQNLLSPEAIVSSGHFLEEAIRPSGYYNQKAIKLRILSRHILDMGGIHTLRGYETLDLRRLLLSWKGIGPETADSILCYGFNRPVFVVDTYTRRLFEKADLPSGSYEEIQESVHEALPPSSSLYGDFHARIVKVSVRKEFALLFATPLSEPENRKILIKAFCRIPGVGPKIAEDFWDMGFRVPEELRGSSPETLYDRLNRIRGLRIDRCMLYVFRCAVYYMSESFHDPEKLKWWNWKD